MAKRTQGNLLRIFEAAKARAKPYGQRTVGAGFDIQCRYKLWSEQHEAVIPGKKRVKWD